jgi:hypothetical protein
MTEPMRAAPPSRSWNTSVLLSAATRARYEAAGMSMAALIEKGLDYYESQAAGAGELMDPVNVIMRQVERVLRASLNEHGMIAWPPLPEGTPPELEPQPRTGPVRMRRAGRRPTLCYQAPDSQQA